MTWLLSWGWCDLFLFGCTTVTSNQLKYVNSTPTREPVTWYWQETRDELKPVVNIVSWHSGSKFSGMKNKAEHWSLSDEERRGGGDDSFEQKKNNKIPSQSLNKGKEFQEKNSNLHLLVTWNRTYNIVCCMELPRRNVGNNKKIKQVQRYRWL